jgi:short-subunit dehydrogenase
MTDCYLVTGASAGLGAGFAARLAAEGHDLVLVARRADRLEQLAAALRDQHGIAVTVIVADLTEAGAVAQLMADIERQRIAVSHLINNAGFGLRGAFADLDGPSQARMIDLNCRVPVELCHAVLPAMLASGRGGILNVASTAAFQPGPWMSVYYATKAFLLSFSEGLHEEVRARGVSVAALCPGPTRTEFFEVADMADSVLSRLLAGEPGKVVGDGLAALRSNRAVTVSGRLNAALAGSMRFTPRRVARKMAGTLQKARGA